MNATNALIAKTLKLVKLFEGFNEQDFITDIQPAVSRWRFGFSRFPMQSMRFCFRAAVVAVSLALPGVALAQAAPRGNPPATAPAPTHPLAGQLANLGALNCAGRANQIARFLAGPTAGISYIAAIPDNPDHRLLAPSLVYPVKGHGQTVATIALAPNQANGCGGGYTTINFEPIQCDKMSSSKYSKIKFVLLGETGVRLGEIPGGPSIFLMPAGKGCNVIKGELVR